MQASELIKQITQHKTFAEFESALSTLDSPKVMFKGLIGSLKAFLASAFTIQSNKPQLFILNTKEEAAYFYTDLCALQDPSSVFFYPKAKTYVWEDDRIENEQSLQRAEVLNAIQKRANAYSIVTYPEALLEKTVSKEVLDKNSIELKAGESYSIDFITEFLVEFGFDHVDFVYGPGQFSIRGGIVDIFSFANDNPYRIEFFGDMVESIRVFEASTQLSISTMVKLTILPSIQHKELSYTSTSFFNFLDKNTIVWSQDIAFQKDRIEMEIKKLQKEHKKQKVIQDLSLFYLNETDFERQISVFPVVQFDGVNFYPEPEIFSFSTTPQPSFKKNFDLLHDQLEDNIKKGAKNYIFSHNPKQIERLYSIFEDLNKEAYFTPCYIAIHEGFICESLNMACYTDHGIFESFHRYKLKEGYRKSQQAASLKDLISLQKGDFVVHSGHGIGVFDGLQKIETGGVKQEAIRILYRDNDLLYVNIHSLHKISKYSGKEGKQPKLEKLGTKTWAVKKSKAKAQVKKVAFDLIQLYAKRKAQSGFAFAPDTYLQTELEASFMFEDTPDQLKCTEAVKKDMESDSPMDRLICGDVGFGKTEIAIRAAFKAAIDGKQVAILAPTTILTLQHFKTFEKRLKGFPITVDFINRFKTSTQKKETLQKLKEGKVDIIVGTHALVGKSVEFKDLGLLIIDEEHKFGVGVKDKLKTIKTNVDTLTLTATPIPRTLQFSLMNARDMSVMSTPPPNRQPVETILNTYNEELISNAIYAEVARGGQVYFIHNRVKNIMDIAGMIKRICPKVSVGVGHGQMKPEELEKKMLGFMDGQFDVLVATTIVESGLDIPNANTIIINAAQNFGLSDLHQMRGRVGRSNRKAYCMLITPPLSAVSDTSRKRLKVIEQFSDIGSGFNIAMRDLDIRGAGDLLGAEQSGFISDIGYETYQKILNEAMQELKENEFKSLFDSELKNKESYVVDCNLDTDLELIFPDNYINNVTERLSLYKDLSEITNQENLSAFKNSLIDRFGPLPKQVVNLFESVELKWLGKELNFEKLSLKKKRLSLSFISNPNSAFYSSGKFAAMMQKIQQSSLKPELKQKGDKLRVIVQGVQGVQEAKKILSSLK